MFALRILTGSLAGKQIQLKKGKNIIGRSPSCQIQILENGISKEHAEIEVNKETLSIKDLQSTNGIYLNGVRIQTQVLRLGDKIKIHEVLMQVEQANAVVPVQRQDRKPALPQQPRPAGNRLPAQPGPQAHQVYQQVAPQVPGGYRQVNSNGSVAQTPAKPIWQKMTDYLDQTALPAVYHLTTIFEYKFVFALIIAFFAVALTLLSLIPMIAITSESIDTESRRRAFTIARNLANLNQVAILNGSENSINVQSAQAEEGVDKAYIIKDADGSVIAPAEEVGNIPDISLIEKARNSKSEMSAKNGVNQIVVTVPISMFSADAGAYVTKAHAVVVYDMGSLAFDDNRVLSLFIQTLFLATILGLFVYYLIYKLIEFPYREIDRLVDSALREKRESISYQLQFPLLEDFVSKLNTALSRAALASDTDQNMGVNREIEAENVVKLIGYGAIAVKQDLSIIAVNDAFLLMLGLSEAQVKHQPITLLPDQALQKNVIDLIDRSAKQMGTIETNELEFGGHPYQLNSQAVTGDKSLEYIIITVVPMGGHG